MNLELRKMALAAAREAGVAEPSTQKLEKFAELVLLEVLRVMDVSPREAKETCQHFGVE
jgi:hypothetical protein